MSPRTGAALGLARRWALPIALAVCLRALSLTPSLPYIAYVDEGHVLHPTMQLIRSGSWDPGWYGYPPLTFYLVSFAAKGVDFLQRSVTTGGSLVEDIPSRDDIAPPTGRVYDILGPIDLIVTGRLVMLLLGLGTVVVSGLLGVTVSGPRTGWVAALIVACCPSFVIRGSYVMVDTATTFFTTLTLYLVARSLRQGRDAGDELARPSYVLALGAGLAAALATASKYSVAILVPVALGAVLVASPSVARAVRTAVAFAAGLVAGFLLGAPTFAFRFHEIVDSLREQTALYAIWPATAPFLSTALEPYELGLPLLLCGAAGLWQILRRREHRAVVWTWLVFAALLVLPFLRYGFQPFRNLLPLCPLLAVAAAHFLVGWFERREGTRRVVAPAIGVLAGALVAVSFGTGLLRFRDSLVPRDSRVEAIDWLVPRVGPGDQVLVLRELAILPSEMRRLPARTRTVTCQELTKAAGATPLAYLVVGASRASALPDDRANPPCDLLPAASEIASFGSVPTPAFSDYWRTNREALRILKTSAPATPALSSR